MLHVLLPVTFIFRSRFIVNIDAIAIRFVIFPISFIVVSIGMCKFPFAFSFVVDPLPFIQCTIRPFLFSESITHVSQPFTLILYPVFESNQRFSFTVETIITIIIFFNEHIAVVHLFLLDLLELTEFLVYFQNITVIFFLGDVLTSSLGLYFVWLLFFDGCEFAFFEFVAERFWDVVANVLAGCCIAHGSQLIIQQQIIPNQSITIQYVSLPPALF